MNEISSDNTIKVVFDIHRYVIRIHRTTIKALGNPKFILFLVNPTDKSFAIIPTNTDDKKGHRLNYDTMKKGHSCELYSRPLIKSIYSLFPEWNTGEKYIIDGKFVRAKNIAYFDMNTAKPLATRGDF